MKEFLLHFRDRDAFAGPETPENGRVKEQRRFHPKDARKRARPASSGPRGDSAFIRRRHRDGGYAGKMVRLAGFEPTTFSSGG